VRETVEPMAPFDTAFAALRALHAGGTIVLFGELLFARAVLDRGIERRDAWPARVLGIAWVVATLAWVAWLVVEAAAMAGTAWSQALPLVGRVLADTSFGHLWLLRAVLLLALGAWLLRSRHAHEAPSTGPLLAGLVLATLAWAGHANAQGGLDGAVHHLADALHVLAAGAWIGSLRPLAASLDEASSVHPGVARTVHRYGRLGFACVAVLVGSGVVNAAYTLGAPARLVDSAYGHLLLAKLALFTVILAVAAANRWWLTPAIAGATAHAQSADTARGRMQRLAWLEGAIGLAIVALAGALGSAAPPMPH
jgi:putative copper resistance protein D